MQNQNYFQFQKKISYELIQELYDSKSKFLWMDSNLKKSQILSYLFYYPIEWIVCKEKENLYAKLSELDYALKNGYWLAGFFSYEVGEILQGFSVENRDFPYFQFAVYEKPLVFCELEEVEKDFSFKLSNIKTSISEEEYLKNILTIKELIEAGKVYQINYTFLLEFDFLGSYLDFYLALRKQQKTDYSAFVFYDLPILSLSPELFFKIQKTRIQTKPMKGTFTKSLNLQEELKNKAENFMITDLLRNDLGKICKLGTVEVKNLFQEEKYNFLKQFTSTVRGFLHQSLSLSEIVKALFPGGSITGAPKREAMKHISYLEKTPREIYTGSIGYFSPKKKALFNIAIRTVQLNAQSGKMGVGSGIVYDSHPKEEWKECFVKARFFLNTLNFSIFETLLLNRGKFFLKQLHLDRLFQSCEFFGFALEQEKFFEEVSKLEAQFPTGRYRVKWIVEKNGRFRFEIFPYPNKTPKSRNSFQILISKKKVQSKNIFLYYKTTEREFYNFEYDKLNKEIFIDKIFLNEREELTEGCITNIFVLIRGIYYTPPKSSGLLEGTFRSYLLKKFPKFFQERVLKLEDLVLSKKIFLCNSLRGIVKAKGVKLENDLY